MKPTLLAIAVLSLSSLVAVGQTEELKPLKVWKGSVADDTLQKTAPEIVVSQKTLDALWEQWKQPGKAPQVDFEKELVAIVTSRGSLVNLNLKQEGKNLKVFGFGTLDFRDGFRFVMGTTPRAGIETVNGKTLPKE